MKILLVNKYHYRRGGSESYYFALARALEQKGHTVVFFSMKDPKNLACAQEPYFVSHVDYHEKASPVRKLKNGLRLIYSREAKKKMERLILREKPDLAILNLVHRQITLSVADALYRHRVPIFFIVHDMICICPAGTMLSSGKVCEKCLGGRFYHCVIHRCIGGSFAKSALAAAEACLYRLRGTYDRIDRYLSPSIFLKDRFERASFTRSPILFLRNPLPADTRYRLPAPPGDYFLYFGRLSPEKGLLTLLKALLLLISDGPARLLIAGEGPQRRELERFAAEHRLPVLFLGFSGGRELENIVAGSRCVILPSEWYENCPYSVMEAMAGGRPAIVSDMGGLPELVEDGANGFVFRSGDARDLCGAMRKMKDLSGKEYEDMSRNALEKACARFDAGRYVDRIVELYSELKRNGRREPV